MPRYTLRESLPENALDFLGNKELLTTRLLYNRGIRTKEEADSFLNPSYEMHGHDPFLLKNMERAVLRTLEAIRNKEHIAIFSDYDADGIPGAVVLHDFFKKIGVTHFENYIPNRHTEGFGLNSEAINILHTNGAKLLITIDCGIADVKEVEHAEALGMHVIVTDHHMPGELPKAFAILNPKQEGCRYPEKMLCGSGVIFKFVQALIRKGNFDIKEGWEKWLLDMVGIATLSDMVPLQGENRVFAHFGLKVLRKSPRQGLRSLLTRLKASQRDLTEDDVGFTISPRINAASRMGVPMDAFTLLSTQDEIEADLLAEHLNKINDERKGMVAAMVKEMRKTIAKRTHDRERKILVLGNPSWRPALLGLAANTLMGELACPVFLWGREGEGVLKGSCRSNGSVSVVELMKAAGPLFLEYGGHALSGGFSVSHEQVHLLEEELERAYEKLREGAFEKEPLYIDTKLSLDEINWNTYRSLEGLAPFGVGNPKPLFLFENIELFDVRRFGKEKNHLEFIFRKTDGKKVSAIGFYMNEGMWGEPLLPGKKINLVATLEKSVFRNFPELRLRIVDIL